MIPKHTPRPKITRSHTESDLYKEVNPLSFNPLSLSDSKVFQHNATSDILYRVVVNPAGESRKSRPRLKYSSSAPLELEKVSWTVSTESDNSGSIRNSKGSNQSTHKKLNKRPKKQEPISFNEFYALESSGKESCKQNNNSIILKFNNKQELIEFQRKLITRGNVKFLDQIKSIILPDLNSDLCQAANLFLNTIAEKQKLFNKLRALHIGNIESGGTFILPEKLNQISSFSAKNILDDATLIIPQSFNSLIRLRLGNIEGTLTLPSLLSNLEKLSYKTIRSEQLSQQLKFFKKNSLCMKKSTNESSDIAPTIPVFNKAGLKVSPPLREMRTSANIGVGSHHNLAEKTSPQKIPLEILTDCYDYKDHMILSAILSSLDSTLFTDSAGLADTKGANKISISLNELFYSSLNPKIQYIVLVINSSNEIQEFGKLIEEQNAGYFMKIQELHFHNPCQGLCLKDSEYTYLLNLLFATISENIQFFPNLDTIDIGDIDQCPKLSLFNLTNLVVLSFDDIHEHTRIFLPKDCSKLSSLSFKDIKTNYLKLPLTFCALNQFTVGFVENYDIHKALLKALEKSSKLETYYYIDLKLSFSAKENTITFEDISQVEDLNQFLCSASHTKNINKFKKLDFQNISINNETSLIINSLLTTIFEKEESQFLPTNISLGDIEDYVTFDLADVLDNLQILSINNLFINANFYLPNSLQNLKKLSIGNIYRKAQIQFPITLINLKQLSIGTMMNSTEFIKLPNNLTNLQDLTLGDFYANTITNLPPLPSLQNLYIGDIGYNTQINIYALHKDFNTLSIGNVGKDVTFTFHQASKFPNITAQYISNKITFSFSIPLNETPKVSDLNLKLTPSTETSSTYFLEINEGEEESDISSSDSENERET